MTFGLTQEQYQVLNNRVITPLKQSNLKVYIFGSRVKGTYHPYSDIDILIEGEISTDVKNLIWKIKMEMEESNFPFKIDLVCFSNLASSYKENVLQTRVLV